MNVRSSDLAILKEIRSNTRDKRIFVRCSTVIAHEAGYSHEAVALFLDIGVWLEEYPQIVWVWLPTY